MSKKGFTLVELLAVIVILSLLTLLTSTSITKLVKDAKGDLNSTQIELIKSAAETWGAENLTSLPRDGECSYLTLSYLKDYGLIDSNIKDSNTNEKIKDDLKIKISTSKNEKSGKLIRIYEVNPESIEGCYQQIYKNGEVVYFDVTTGKSCTNYKEENSKTGYNGFDGTEPQNGCLKFYAFLDDGGEKLNLLLDHNTTATLAWNSSDSNASGPKEVLEQLKTNTDGWSNEIVTPNNYTYNHATRPYTIDYSEYKARLITAQEIAQITGADKENTLNFKEESSTGVYYYFDSLSTSASNTCKDGNTTGCKYGWLYDRTSTSCTTYGCLNNSDIGIYGYWTSSAHASYSNGAWRVYDLGSVTNDSVNTASYYGVRPVITILKSNI